MSRTYAPNTHLRELRTLADMHGWHTEALSLDSSLGCVIGYVNPSHPKHSFTAKFTSVENVSMLLAVRQGRLYRVVNSPLAHARLWLTTGKIVPLP